MPFLHFQPGPQQQLLNLKPKAPRPATEESSGATAQQQQQQQQSQQRSQQQQQQQQVAATSAADAARLRCMQALQRSCLALMQVMMLCRGTGPELDGWGQGTV